MTVLIGEHGEDTFMNTLGDPPITDTQLLNFMIEEMRGRPWFDIFPLFRPMERFPDGSYQYSELLINPATFREHITAAYGRWEKKP